MPRVRIITCTCGYANTDGYFHEGRCPEPECGKSTRRNRAEFVRIDDGDPAAWLRTGWMAGMNGGNRNGNQS